MCPDESSGGLGYISILHSDRNNFPLDFRMVSLIFSYIYLKYEGSKFMRKTCVERNTFQPFQLKSLH